VQRLRQPLPYDDYLAAFSQTRIPVKWPNAAPNLELRDDIWPTDTAPVIRETDDGPEFTQLRWGFPPARPKGPPVINFRSEGRKFPRGRYLPGAGIPLLRVHRHEITQDQVAIHEDRRAMVLLCRSMAADAGRAGAAFTLLTTDPGPDVAPIHDRQMVILNRDDWSAWLDHKRPEAELLQPLPAGSLQVEQVRP
jgi:putative SOS response-associated peptidase YedK